MILLLLRPVLGRGDLWQEARREDLAFRIGKVLFNLRHLPWPVLGHGDLRHEARREDFNRRLESVCFSLRHPCGWGQQTATKDWCE